MYVELPALSAKLVAAAAESFPKHPTASRSLATKPFFPKFDPFSVVVFEDIFCRACVLASFCQAFSTLTSLYPRPAVQLSCLYRPVPALGLITQHGRL